MAVASLYEGTLIGHSTYVKDGTQYHTYYALIAQKQDEKTKLFGDCELAVIRDDHEAITNPEYGQAVIFYGENVHGKGGRMFVTYSNIRAVTQ